MTLKELKELVAKVEAFGFKDEEVDVEIVYGGGKLGIKSAKTTVSATEKSAKPKLRLEMEHKGSLVLAGY